MNYITRIDSKVVLFLEHRSSLFAACVGLVVCIWSIVLGDYNFVVQLLMTGAIGYSIGFTAAILGDLALFLIQVLEPNFQMNISMDFLQFLGCAYIAWLSFKHHQLAHINRKQSENKNPKHTSHIIPWFLINEVRNSLLAMRLLLFQQANRYVHTGDDQEIKLVQDELLRLELIFSALNTYDETQQQPQK